MYLYATSTKPYCVLQAVDLTRSRSTATAAATSMMYPPSTLCSVRVQHKVFGKVPTSIWGKVFTKTKQSRIYFLAGQMFKQREAAYMGEDSFVRKVDQDPPLLTTEVTGPPNVTTWSHG